MYVCVCVREEVEQVTVLASVRCRRVCQAGASQPSPGISFPCLRSSLLLPCSSRSLVPAEEVGIAAGKVSHCFGAAGAIKPTTTFRGCWGP